MNIHKIVVLLLGILFFNPAMAAVIQTTGSGSAVSRIDGAADFESVDVLTNPTYTEGGMVFTRTNLNFGNNGCGYQGCLTHPGFSGFSGNYLFGSNFSSKQPGFFTISAGNGNIFTGLEFVIGSGVPLPPNQSVYWEAFLNGASVGSGSILAIPFGQVLGFSDLSGFDRLQYTDSLSNSSAAPAFDSVRAQFAPIPVPAALWLFMSAGSVLLSLGRFRSR